MADILIVDDEPDNCFLLEQLLKKCNHKTTSCYNGADACNEAKMFHFDLIFMDIHMPIMDGIATIKRLRRQGYSGKIIIITADPKGANAIAGTKAGAEGFLAKPVTNKICDIVKQFIG